MRLPRAVAAWAAVLTLMPIAAADWSQDGGDAGRSGHMRDGGPAWDDVAIVLAPPTGEGWRTDVAPLSMGREIVAMTNKTIFVIDLDSGAMRPLAPNPPGMRSTPFPTQPASQWAIVGARLYIADQRVDATACNPNVPSTCNAGSPARMRIIDLASGGMVEKPLSDAGAARECSIAVASASAGIYTACVIDAGAAPVGVSPDVLQVRHVGDDGAVLWTWSPSTDPQAAGAPLLQPRGRAPTQLTLVGLSVVGNLVIPVTQTFINQDQGGYWDGWVLDGGSGTLASPPSAAGSRALGSENHFGWGQDTSFVPSLPIKDIPSLVVGDANGWARKERNPFVTDVGLLTLVLSPSRVENFDTEISIHLRGSDSGARITMTSEMIFVATETTVGAFTREGEPVWDTDIASGQSAAPLPLFTDDAHAFAFLAANQGGATRLVAFNMTDGEPRWEHRFEGSVTTASAAPGTLVAIVKRADSSSRLVVLGTTPGSIKLSATASETYPGPGRLVRVDLSGSAPGSDGAPTRYRADWGDGEATPWQNSSVLEHGYNTVGDHTAHVFAGNDAGQVSSQAVDFHVGRAPPQNFLQEQFSNENQERSFFLLGLAVTGLVALVGLVRIRRRRGMLSRELRAIEHVHQMTSANPGECERALAERRTHARALLVDSKLDEVQFAVLERRIDELARGVRLADIELEFGFLTISMAALLRGMLSDGRVERWERDHFLDALERDDHLTREQKTRVRARIDEWFARDAGG